MSASMSEMLRQDVQCEGLLEFFYGLKEIDTETFVLLDEHSEPLTVDEIAEQIDREPSTASRSVQRLLKAGFIQKEQVNYEQSGYFHVYRPCDAEKIAQDMSVR